jgi:hypothetical protein
MLIAIDFARLPGQIQHDMHAPQRITVRLGDDFNWWIDSTDEDEPTPHARGVLDPRQVAHIVETLDEYRPYGYRPDQLTAAFQAYRVDAEISEGVLRLAATDDFGDEAFALPVTGDDETGAYYEFLDALAAARIRKLNKTHHYGRDCTTDEMLDELQALDSDRYFSDETIHVFHEITEILEWSPAEWDESSSSL